MERVRLKPKRVRGGASYLCPKCGSPTHVIVTRRKTKSVERRRECVKCKNEFRTREMKYA